MEKSTSGPNRTSRILSRTTIGSVNGHGVKGNSGSKSGWMYRIKRWNRKHLNFFRIHLLFFTFFPLFMSIILWASSTTYKIRYEDALFMCVSALTSTGLQTLDLSRLTAFQQAVLFVQMFLGSTIVVGWIVVLVRRHIFITQCEHLVRKSNKGSGGPLTKIRSRRVTAPPAPEREQVEEQAEQGLHNSNPPSRRATTAGVIKPFRRDTIRRIDTELRRVDPSGRISREPTLTSPSKKGSLVSEFIPPPPIVESPRNAPLQLEDDTEDGNKGKPGAKDDHSPGVTPASPIEGTLDIVGSNEHPSGLQDSPLPISPAPMTANSSRNVGFNVPNFPNTTTGMSQLSSGNALRHRKAGTMGPRVQSYTEIDIRPKKGATRSQSYYKLPPVDDRFVVKHGGIGLGGFPGPIAMLRRFFKYIMDKFGDNSVVQRFKSYPSILLPVGQGNSTQLARYDTKEVPYFSFAAIVGKNSAFHGLSEDQLEELGGLEYRGLKVLVWLVPAYYLFIQAVGWIVDGVIFSQSRFHSVFTGQWRYVRPDWAGVFIGTSAATNTGMSLVDTGLVPFQGEEGVLIITAFAILAGNTAFPILLRLCIWLGTKFLPSTSSTWATFHFLLDHPRRCFLYLFPSHQTWFLLTIIFILTMIDWMGLLLFDIGNPSLDAIPTNLRVLNGFLQATSVRCAGVASISISGLVPASQVLFVIMMYIAPYPVALAIRSTNVYEDRSLGIYEEEEDTDDEEEAEKAFEKDKRAKSAVWGSYLAWHAKRQLAFDIWWIAGAWLMIAAIERSKIWHLETRQFDLFVILFELISAYGNVGLSLGLSTANYSTSGAFSPASKIIMCLVMIRGRHRGLPVAIDRAVMLPKEFKKTDTGATLLGQDQPPKALNGTDMNALGGQNGTALETIPEKEAR